MGLRAKSYIRVRKNPGRRVSQSKHASKIRPDSEPVVPDSKTKVKKYIRVKRKKLKNKPDSKPAAPDLEPTAPDSAPTAPVSEPTAPDSAPTAPDSAPTTPDSEQTAPNLVTDSERNTPGSDEITTDLNRLDTKGWLAKDQVRHKQQVRASLWSDASSE